MDGLYSHSAYLLQELQDQRIQGLLCDCTLVVKGVCFKAHKNVLAAFSSYFRSLFQNSLKTDVFHLAIQDVGGIGQVLDYMYTSRLELNQDNTHTLLHIAKCLQVSNILNMCSAYLKPCTVSGETGLSIPALPSHEQDCVLGVPSPAEQDRINSHTDLPKHLLLPHDPDPIHCRRPQPAPLPSTLETANNMSALSERQPAHGYKLRNFYSKQYFKQTAVQNGTSRQSHVQCPPVVEEQYNTGSSSQTLQNAGANTANQTLQNTANSQSLPAVPSSSANQLLPHISSHSGRSVLTECAISQTSASCASVPCADLLSAVLPPAFSSQPVGGRQSPPVPRALRHKKALYLKKYLRSQPMLEEGVEQSTEMESCSTERVQQVEPQSQPAQISINTPPEDRLAESGEGAELPVPPRAPSPSPPRAPSPSSPRAPSPPHPQVPSPPPPQPETSTGQAGRSRFTNGSNKYCCEMCGKTFKHPSNLELHKRSHTGEKPFQCIVCGKNFSQAGNLQTHLRRHSGEKPYICELCGKSFAASGDVQRHIIIHSGARPHLCDICGWGFSNFSNLKEHKRTHSLEREFTCEQCGKSFNMQRKLIKHTLTHTGERRYCCHTCGKSFAGSGDLHRHMRSHTGERPYVCSTCGKGFTRMAVLRRHRTSTCKPSPPAPPPSSGQGPDLCPAASTPPNPAPSSSAPHAHKAPVKPRPRAEPPFSSCCEENGAPALADSAGALLAPAGPSSSGSQPHAAPYRSSEGFCSSGTLWVLDEKDLPE